MGFIRMFLALVVVVGHFQQQSKAFDIGAVSPFATLGLNAGYAVMFFFAISGFLMSVVLSEKYEPTAAGTLAFYRSRFIRIFSLYWPLVLVLLIVPPFGSDVRAAFQNAAWADKIAYVTLTGTDWRLVLPEFPKSHSQATLPYIQQSWALSLELSFYLLAPFLLRSWKAVAVVLVGSIAWRLYMIEPRGQFTETLRYYFFPATVCFFLMGDVARRASARFPVLQSGRCAVVFLAVSILAMTGPGPWVYWDTPRFWISICSFALALPGIFAVTKNWKVSNVFGDLSYGVYLVHIAPLRLMMAYGIFPMLVAWFPEGQWRAYAFIGAFSLGVIALAYLVHTFIEKPVARGMRSGLSRVGIQ